MSAASHAGRAVAVLRLGYQFFFEAFEFAAQQVDEVARKVADELEQRPLR
jgi:hypothetical protein